MAIPGYDPDDIEEFRLEREADAVAARASVVAATVPDTFGLEPSDSEVPESSLTEPVDVVGLGGVSGLDAMRIAIEYDPSTLPPEADPTDVAIAVATDDGFETLDSAVDLETANVRAVLTELPPGETVVAIHDDAEAPDSA